ncbi:hypothetical protein ENBRE01_2563 [Enteropsectra breve]|nr:hypothetical protein ENBRE01_2563 [Enteropsectra breve]
MAMINKLSFGIAALVIVVVLGLGTYKVFKKDGKPESAPQTPPAAPQPQNIVPPKTSTPNNITRVGPITPEKFYIDSSEEQETRSQPQHFPLTATPKIDEVVTGAHQTSIIKPETELESEGSSEKSEEDSQPESASSVHDTPRTLQKSSRPSQPILPEATFTSETAEGTILPRMGSRKIQISPEIAVKQNDTNDYFAKYVFEPIEMASFNQFKSDYAEHIPIAMCMRFLLGCGRLDNLLSKNQFNSNTQPFLSLLKHISEDYRHFYDIIRAHYAELNCQANHWQDFNDIMEFLIRKISEEDNTVHQIFNLQFIIESTGGTVAKTYNNKTINLNDAVELKIKPQFDISNIFSNLLNQKALSKDYSNIMGIKVESTSMKYNDAIVITTDRYMQIMRDHKIEHQSEFSIPKSAHGSKYKLKCIFYETINPNDKTRFKFLVSEVKQFDAFDEDTKNEWIRKLLTNAIFLLYERENE